MSCNCLLANRRAALGKSNQVMNNIVLVCVQWNWPKFTQKSQSYASRSVNRIFTAFDSDIIHNFKETKVCESHEMFKSQSQEPLTSFGSWKVTLCNDPSAH